MNDCHCKCATRNSDEKVGKMVTFEATETIEMVAIDHIGALIPVPQGFR